MRFVVVTGMSGGGKSTALKMLEDAGFYCVDNLPISLLDKFIELIATPGSEITRVALGLDVRAGQSFTEATSILQKQKDAGKICYSVGYNIDMLETAPTAALTSATNVWEVYYEYLFKSMMDGENPATNWSEGYNEGAVAITDLGPKLPKALPRRLPKWKQP